MNALTFFNPRFTSDLFDVIERNFSDYLPSTHSAHPAMVSPKVDVRETKDAYIMEMDLPGMNQKDVDISVKDKILSISSVKEEKKDEKEGDWVIKERRTMSFARRFTLPEDINAEKISASFKSGVLIVNIPRKPEVQPRNIQIKASEEKKPAEKKAEK
ncbi:MAG: Hsp20/alpha crystallin family protein [Spirochaetaceae bacterium]|jgi:HSP20 family protein|nr:Hsp20/alpha crystallin family protein [Spirochaetaceae bacterium]